LSRHASVKVNRPALKENFLNIKSRLYPHQQVMAIVKADAYGVGALEAAKTFAGLGAAYFGVASIHEALELREGGVKGPVLVLSPFLKEELGLFFEYGITPTIVDRERARMLSVEAVRRGREAVFHFKLDTGMGRLGLSPEEALPELQAILALDSLKLEGVFSHFPGADELDSFSLEQIQIFKDFIGQLTVRGIDVPFRHMTNSSGILAFNDPDFNLVRPGLILYGAHPSSLIREKFHSRHVIEWKSVLLFQKNMLPGQSISYGRTFMVPKPMRVGVVGAGYADGFSTFNSNKAQVQIAGKLVRVLGRDSMCPTAVKWCCRLT